MKSRSITCWKRKGVPVAAFLVLMAVVYLGIRQWRQTSAPPKSAPTLAQTYPGLDLQDPAADFETLRYTADTGGNENTRAQAIVWLDQQTRTLQPLSPRQEEWMFGMLRTGGHPQWDKDYKFWLLNSAFNPLHHGPRQQDLTKLLAHLTIHDPEKTIRLYALQHLEAQRTGGRLTGPLADEVRVILMDVANAPDSQEAGLAIRFLAEWDGTDRAATPDITDKAIQLAADATRAVDLRVSALHAAGPAALPLARDLSLDSTQPTLLRKASIALIGTHGGESDISPLQKLSAENSRLAQAADPATRTIRHRLSAPNAPAPIPF